jgi:DNA-binding PadR family transcriptional regulator
LEIELLVSLLAGEAHGYAVLQRVERRGSLGESVHAGSLYRALFRLESRGLIVASRNRPRRPKHRKASYKLSPVGRKALEVEIERLRVLLSAGEERGLGET